MENKKIYIFTIATDIYKGYIPFLEASLANLSPLSKVFDVELILISDRDCISETPHKYLHICNMPYPFNTYHKFDYIHDAISFLNLQDDAYFIYVDADSIFRKMEPNFYTRTLPNLLDNGKITLARSPWRLTSVTRNENYGCKGTPSYIERLDSRNNYAQASMFMGSIKKFEEVYPLIYGLMTSHIKERREHPSLPLMFDQSIINKVANTHNEFFSFDDLIFNIYEDLSLEEKEFLKTSYKEKNLVKCNKTYHMNKYSNIFVIQKFNQGIKKEKRL